MLFPQDHDYSDQDIKLIRTLLEQFVGQTMDQCRKAAENAQFILLDRWDDKMGFFKESEQDYMILSLLFSDNKCVSYRLIIKDAATKWADSKVIDYDSVRDAGIV